MTAATTTTPAVPEPGQVVEVRGATWAVTEVREQGLPRSSADDATTTLEHVVGLQSIDEDRLGEELAVVWELEVGHTLVPEQGLPDRLDAYGFDDPNTLGAYVDAARWGAVTNADDNSFQSPFRSGATVEPFQLEPLRRALAAPRTNLLLADDVGLGKTIEAGLVIQELLLRHRAQTAVIVCPPSLSIKWQSEMREKFGLDFTVVDSARLAQDRRRHGLAANPFRLHRRVIVSMAWLPTPRAQRLLRDVLDEASHATSARRYAFDILVVDEAHHVAPSSPTAAGGSRGYAVDSQRTVAVRTLAERCEHRLFLSATPHNGHTESFTALLEMIDNRRFSRGATLDEQALREVTVRRLKRDITDKGFLPRQIKSLAFEPAVAEVEAFELLSDVLKRHAEVQGRKSAGDILTLLLKKRFLSSPWSFARTLEQYEAAPTGWEGQEDEYAEIFGQAAADEEEGRIEHPEFGAAAGTKVSPLASASQAEVERLVAWGLSYENRPDARLEALIDFLDGVCRIGRSWSNERVVVFTEYATTLEWVTRVLASRGYDDSRLAAIQGSTPAEERETIRARFTSSPSEEPLRVLVATDAAGEGIDLQNFCYRLVNLDVPFNPSRLEQRIGRIDRYGQTHAPEVYYFSPVTTTSTFAADQDFVARLARKVSTVRDDLGSVNALVDDEVQRRFLGVVELPRTASNDRGAHAVNAVMAGEQQLNRELTELARTYDEQREQMHLTPFNVRRVVETALDLSREAPLAVYMEDEAGIAESFTVDHLSHRWGAALSGLDTVLRPGELRPITFDPAVAEADPDIVHVHLGHPILQKASRLLRSNLIGSGASLFRATAVVDDAIPESCVAAMARLVLVGRGGLRLHEEVFVSGVRLHGNDLAEEKVEQLLDSVLDRPGLLLADEAVRRGIAAEWNADGLAKRRRLEEALRRKASRRQVAVTSSLDARREADSERARGIYRAFRRNLTESLSLVDETNDQMSFDLFADDQKSQRLRDIRAMEERLETLDGEEQRELAGIAERYADVRPYVTAVAVVFALTPADARVFGGER